MAEKMSFREKLLSMEARLKFLKKTATIAGGGAKYTYTPAADVTRHVGAALADNRLVIVGTETKYIGERNGGFGTEPIIGVKVTIGDCDSDETASFSGIGAAGDAKSDKALPKSNTVAMRYLWLQAFNIATGDEELDVHTARLVFDAMLLELAAAQNAPDVARVYAERYEAIKAAGEKINTEAKGAVKRRMAAFNITSGEAITALVQTELDKLGGG